jgi:hypothetical protein
MLCNYLFENASREQLQLERLSQTICSRMYPIEAVFFTPCTFSLLHGPVLLFHRNFAMALQMDVAYIKVCANTNFLVKFLKIVAQFLEKILQIRCRLDPRKGLI